jgi:hypothetical protein
VARRSSDENMGGLDIFAKLMNEDAGTQGRDVIGAVEADKLFDLGRGEAEVSVRQRLLEGRASTGECISMKVSGALCPSSHRRAGWNRSW